MREKNHIKAIAEVILKTLREDFENVKILDVHVEDDSSYEDDDFLRVEVIFEGSPKNMGVLSEVVRHVRPKLRDIEETRFPVFSFTENTDLINEKALAAT